MEKIQFDDIDALKAKITDEYGGWSNEVEITQDATDEMHDARAGDLHDPAPRLAQSVREVGALVVQEETLVEQADALRQFAAHEEALSGDGRNLDRPVRLPDSQLLTEPPAPPPASQRGRHR